MARSATHPIREWKRKEVTRANMLAKEKAAVEEFWKAFWMLLHPSPWEVSLFIYNNRKEEFFFGRTSEICISNEIGVFDLRAWAPINVVDGSRLVINERGDKIAHSKLHWAANPDFYSLGAFGTWNSIISCKAFKKGACWRRFSPYLFNRLCKERKSFFSDSRLSERFHNRVNVS